MKKILITVLFAALALTLCACDKKDTQDTQDIQIVENTDSAVVDEDETKETAEPQDIEAVSKSAPSKKNNTSSKDDTSSDKGSSSATTTASSEISSEQSEINSEEDVIPIEIESEPTGYESEILGKWNAWQLLDPSGNEVSGEELYGSAYKTYGGTIEFYDDNTFALRMGVSSDDATSTGTYTYEGADEIVLHFYDDSTSVCTKQNINGKENIIMPFEIFSDTFTVYFEM